MKTYIVIPAYNEEEHIKSLLEKVAFSGKFPVILVDDGSADRTYRIAKGTGVHVLKHRINLGKGAALKTGCDAAFKMGAEAVILMDSDGQHNVKDLHKFTEALDKGNDIVFGSRKLTSEAPLVRFLGNKFASLLISFLFDIYISDLLCGYRAFTKGAYRKIKWGSAGYGVETEMVVNTSYTNLKYCEVPVETVYLSGVKGVTILDAFNILGDVIRWRINK